MNNKVFKIRLAQTHQQRDEVSMLISKMYTWRGYETSGKVSDQPHRVTLVASSNDATLATITIGFDSLIGLMADELYKSEIDALRRQGKRLCEFVKLAVDEGVRSKHVLATIFHLSYIYAREVQEHADLYVVIEVNPRHVKFYQNMLGFEKLGGEKINQRVKAPAILLGQGWEYAQRKVQEFGGRPHLAASEKSLYPYFFSPAEEEQIAQQLRSVDL
jgi:hypothetical protein